MKARPVRGGCCSGQLIGGLLIVGLLTACAGDDAASAGAVAAGTRVETVQPAICGTDAVISAEAADTATPRTSLEMQADILVNPPANPPGFRSQTVIVDGGLGSFRVTLPEGYLPVWRFGTPGGDVLDLGRDRDRDWARHWGGRMSARDVNIRAISLDINVPDQVVAVLLTLTELQDEGDELAEDLASFYSDGGGVVAEACGVRANGADGAYIEHTVPGNLLGSATDRTQLQFLIPDKPNGALWGVTCDVPQALVTSEIKQTCREMASMFRPLPEIR